MFYCPKCMLLNNNVVCYHCGKRKLKEVKVNDPVYLTQKDAFLSYSLEELLEKRNIPYIKDAMQGAGLTSKMGFGTEIYTFFVPFGAYEEAKDIVQSISVSDEKF